VKFFTCCEWVLHTNTDPFCPESLSVWTKSVKKKEEPDTSAVQGMGFEVDE
jgi:hypothetical protein